MTCTLLHGSSASADSYVPRAGELVSVDGGQQLRIGDGRTAGGRVVPLTDPATGLLDPTYLPIFGRPFHPTIQLVMVNGVPKIVCSPFVTDYSDVHVATQWLVEGATNGTDYDSGTQSTYLTEIPVQQLPRGRVRARYQGRIGGFSDWSEWIMVDPAVGTTTFRAQGIYYFSAPSGVTSLTVGIRTVSTQSSSFDGFLTVDNHSYFGGSGITTNGLTKAVTAVSATSNQVFVITVAPDTSLQVVWGSLPLGAEYDITA